MGADPRFGWIRGPRAQARDRVYPDPLLRDFVFGTQEAAFRVVVPPGRYAFEVMVGDADYGDRTLALAMEEAGTLPRVGDLRPEMFARVTWQADIEDGAADIVVAPAPTTWALSGLRVARVPREGTMPAPAIERVRPRIARENHWPAILKRPDATTAIWAEVLAEVAREAPAEPGTPYLATIEHIVADLAPTQTAEGIVLDAVEHKEIQYTTPAFAYATAVQVAAGRADRSSAARRAVAAAIQAFVANAAPSDHEDFYPFFLARAVAILQDTGAAEAGEVLSWRSALSRVDPFFLYTMPPGRGNWNAVAGSGEAVLFALGLRASRDFADDSLAGQSAYFLNDWGQHVSEGGHPAYDLFPRVWMMAALRHGYTGPDAGAIGAALGRGARTSALLLTPTGSLPPAGRGASHVWNDAAATALFELAARDASARGDHDSACLFQTSAAASHASLRQWLRAPTGVYVVKNRVTLADKHGFDGYSHVSQYSALTAAFLALAHESRVELEGCHHAAAAQSGTYVLDLRETMGMIIVAARGSMAVMSARHPGEHAYTPAGIVYAHVGGASGITLVDEGFLKGPNFLLPTQKARPTASLEPRWVASGKMTTISDDDNNNIKNDNRYAWKIEGRSVEAGRACVVVVAQPEVADVERPGWSQRLCVAADAITLEVEAIGERAPVFGVAVPVIVDDGRDAADVRVDGTCVAIVRGERAGQICGPAAPERVAERLAARRGWGSLLYLPSAGPGPLRVRMGSCAGQECEAGPP